MPTTSYINLGPSGGYQPSETEIGVIKTNLQIGTSSTLNAVFENGDLTLTDILTPSNSIILYKSEALSEAVKLTTSRAFSITGDVSTAAPSYFDGTDAVVFNTTLRDNSVTAAKIEAGTITIDKLSVGKPVWTSSGNLSITPTSSIESSFIIGDKRATDNVASLKFQTEANSVTSTTNSSVTRGSGINGDFVILNNGTGKVKFQTGGAFDRVTIDSAGKFGIGTTIPAFKLHVETGLPTNETAIYVAPSTGVSSRRAELMLGGWSLRQDMTPSNILDFAIGNTASGGFVPSIYFGATDGRIGIKTSTLDATAALTVNGNVKATTFIGAVTGKADNNVINNSTNYSTTKSITLNADTPAALTISIGGGVATPTWPISGITGNAVTADTATLATTVSAGSISSTSLNGSQTGTAPIYGARAYGNCTEPPTSASGGGALYEGTFKNVAATSAITYISTGVYDITFTQAMPASTYTVIMTGENSITVITAIITNKTVNGFRATFENYANGPSAAQGFNFVVFA